jgi:tetratricopeptide (TPR) repeat protein
LMTLPARRRARSRRKVARIGVYASVILAVMLTASTVLIVRENRLRVIAVNERDTANAMLKFLTEMFSSVDPTKTRGGKGRDVKVADLLDEATKNLDEMAQGKPEVAAALRATIGNSYKGIALYNEAVDQLTNSLELRRKTLSSPHKDIAQNLHDLAAAYWWWQHYDKAEPLYREALEMRETLFGHQSIEVAESLNHLAACIDSMRNHPREEAEKLYRDCLAIRQKLLKPNDPVIAATMNNLATCLRAQNKYDDAEKLSRSALEIMKSHEADRPADLAGAYSNLALVLGLKKDAKDHEEAIKLYAEALRLKRQQYTSDHPSVAITLQAQGELLYRDRKYDQAGPLFAEAYEIRRKFLPNENQTAQSEQMLAQVKYQQHALDESAQMLREVIQIRESKDTIRLPETKVFLGAVMLEQGKYEEAEKYLVDGYKELSKSSNIDVPFILNQIVELYDKLKKPDLADKFRSELTQFSNAKSP